MALHCVVSYSPDLPSGGFAKNWVLYNTQVLEQSRRNSIEPWTPSICSSSNIRSCLNPTRRYPQVDELLAAQLASTVAGVNWCVEPTELFAALSYIDLATSVAMVPIRSAASAFGAIERRTANTPTDLPSVPRSS